MSDFDEALKVHIEDHNRRLAAIEGLIPKIFDTLNALQVTMSAVNVTMTDLKEDRCVTSSACDNIKTRISGCERWQTRMLGIFVGAQAVIGFIFYIAWDTIKTLVLKH